MRIAQKDEPNRQKPLVLWPGVVAVVLQWLVWLVSPIILPDYKGGYAAALGLLVGGLAIVVWWVFFSRAPRIERWGAVVLMMTAMVIAPRFLHESIARGNMGVQYFLYTIPFLSLAFVAWAVGSRRLSVGLRRATMATSILLACGVWILLRSDGITGDAKAEFAWRWAETSEERLLAQALDEPPTVAGGLPSASAAADGVKADWEGFRGPDRSGVISGLQIETDWSRSPPVELWRRPIGPGVSSFAVSGGLLYTQEQRGNEEVVSSYKVSTGEPVWKHYDEARFWDAHVGAGPRATPAVSGGRVYTFGATGLLNSLQADNGVAVWTRDVASDTEAKLPQFGFTSSPLVVDDVVVITAGGALLAYDLNTGNQRWERRVQGGSYSSPHVFLLDGVEQILLLGGAGTTSVSPADGKLLWEYPPGIGIAQPTLTTDGDLLIGMVSDLAGAYGTRRIAVAHDAGGWKVEERWTSNRLKPYFSPLIVHAGHAYGFDGRIMACIDIEDGQRKWKGGRYGSGQILLLSDQDLLLVLSERGELVLVEASPDRFTEIARFDALKSKTWTQPALVGDVLLARNREEMAAFRLPLAGG